MHDGVLIGIGTALADDPQLTCRGEGKEPARIVLDSQLRLGLDARLLEPVAGSALHVFAAEQACMGPKAEALRTSGVHVHAVGPGPGGLDVRAVLEILNAHGLRSVMVEGGGLVAAAFVRASLVSALEWFRAGLLLGGDGQAGIGPLGLARLGDAPSWRRVEFRLLGPDVWERYEKQEGGCSPES